MLSNHDKSNGAETGEEEGDFCLRSLQDVSLHFFERSSASKHLKSQKKDGVELQVRAGAAIALPFHDLCDP